MHQIVVRGEEGFCPLTQRYRVDELNPAFVAACQEAWTLLLQDPEMLDHVQWLTAQLKDWVELPHTAPVDDE
jgi:hypothetical protein